MKTVIFAVLMLLAFSYGEGLKCNECLGRGCTRTQVTCKNAFDVCASVFFQPPMQISYFTRCMKESDCRFMETWPSVSTHCCKTDLCN